MNLGISKRCIEILGNWNDCPDSDVNLVKEKLRVILKKTIPNEYFYKDFFTLSPYRMPRNNNLPLEGYELILAPNGETDKTTFCVRVTANGKIVNIVKEIFHKCDLKAIKKEDTGLNYPLKISNDWEIIWDENDKCAYFINNDGGKKKIDYKFPLMNGKPYDSLFYNNVGYKPKMKKSFIFYPFPKLNYKIGENNCYPLLIGYYKYGFNIVPVIAVPENGSIVITDFFYNFDYPELVAAKLDGDGDGDGDEFKIFLISDEPTQTVLYNNEKLEEKNKFFSFRSLYGNYNRWVDLEINSETFNLKPLLNFSGLFGLAVTCDQCEQTDIKNDFYACCECENYALCQNCYQERKHTHEFYFCEKLEDLTKDMKITLD